MQERLCNLSPIHRWGSSTTLMLRRSPRERFRCSRLRIKNGCRLLSSLTRLWRRRKLHRRRGKDKSWRGGWRIWIGRFRALKSMITATGRQHQLTQIHERQVQKQKLRGSKQSENSRKSMSNCEERRRSKRSAKPSSRTLKNEWKHSKTRSRKP